MTCPFDRARYEALLEGLEISVVPLSQARSESDELRIDSSFFHSSDLLARLENLSAYPLSSITEKLTQGPNPIFVDMGIPCLTGRNIRDYKISLDDADFVSPEEFTRFSSFHLKKRDILITLKGAGSTGKVAIFDKSVPAMFSRNVGLVRLKHKWLQQAEFIYIYFASRYGQELIDRGVTGGTGQLTLPTGYLKRFPVPLFDKLGALIRDLVIESNKKAENAKMYLSSAEQILIHALGLDNWQPPESLTYTRRASEAFAAGRLDAEHYKQKFYAAKERLKEAGARGLIPLDDLLAAITNGHTPLHHNLSVGEVPFLCAEHVTDFEVHYDSEKRILIEHHQGELSRTALRNDDVLFTIKGRVGNAALVENAPDVVNINQDVALLRFNNRLPIWYILAYLNSSFGRLQVEQMSTGGINPFLGLSNVRRLQIPEFDESKMGEIGNQTRAHVHKARAARIEARSLLERAKRAVEVAIEEGEEAGLALLDTGEGG